jgi:WD40 repeat protein
VATSGSGITIVSTEDPSRQVQLQGHTETFKRGWQEAVGAPAFSPEGSFLVSAGSRQSGGKDPRTVRLWDPITGEQLLRIIVDGDCLAASVDPFSETICVGCEHRLLLVPVERWLLSGDTTAIKQSTERLLGARAEDLL